MDQKQLWLFEELTSQNHQIKNNLSSLSEEDCQELGQLFAELLINFLNKKKENSHADNHR